MAKYVGGEFIIESDSDGIQVTMNCEHGAHEEFSWKALEEDGVCRRPYGWIKVSDAPIPGYETVLMGLWVYNNRTGKMHFEQYILQYDPELGELWDGDNSFSDWNISDFEFWMPLPSAPEVEK